MTFDLTAQRWLAARRRDGRLQSISPAEVASGDGDTALVDLAAPRPDFRAAHYQFLIGLLQTTFAPETELSWRRLYERPPSEADLRKAFSTVAPAFDLMHPDRPFMQEAYLRADPKLRKGEDVRNVSSLLIGSPGDETIRKGTDFFARAKEHAFCAPCAASAVVTLQTNAPQGGRGQTTSIRGGGPLTTLILGDDGHGESLWRTLWLNVLPKDVIGRDAPSLSPEVFPWLSTWPVEKARRVRTLDQIHPMHHFWGTPRRLLLGWDAPGAQPCTLCGERPAVAREVLGRPDGFQYQGSFDHPLTPWRMDDDVRIPLKGTAEPAAYRHWIALVASAESSKNRPAKVVAHLRDERWRSLPGGRDARLWAFGFETDAAKIGGWYEGRMPVHLVPEELRGKFEEFATQAIAAADIAAYFVRAAVQAAWDAEESVANSTRDPSTRFWRSSEADFYDALERRRLASSEAEAAAVARGWLASLELHALAAFDAATAGRSIADGEPGRVARARVRLLRNLGGKKMRNAMILGAEAVSA